MARSELSNSFVWDDARAFVDDGVIMLRAIDEFGDPVELTEDAALELGRWLTEWAIRLNEAGKRDMND
jgi:hypothetical protein